MIIPAILEKNLGDIKKKIALIDGNCEYIQIDICDGKFVSQSSFANLEMIASIEPISKLELDLMVEDPEKYVQERFQSVFKVLAHIESKGFEKFVSLARQHKYIVGLGVNPETSLDKLKEIPAGIDFVQFSSVHPGKQGAQFIPEVLSKITGFKEMHPNIRTQIDGGVSEENVKSILKTGVDDVVIGSHIVNSEEPIQKIAEFKKLTAYEPSN